MFRSNLLKRAYGLDQTGIVYDQDQDNVRDKQIAQRNPDKQDFVPQNMISDGTVGDEEHREIELAHELLNPHNP